MRDIVLLGIHNKQLDALEEKCEGRRGNTDINKETLKRLIMDHLAVCAAAKSAGIVLKETLDD